MQLPVRFLASEPAAELSCLHKQPVNKQNTKMDFCQTSYKYTSAIQQIVGKRFRKKINIIMFWGYLRSKNTDTIKKRW